MIEGAARRRSARKGGGSHGDEQEREQVGQETNVAYCGFGADAAHTEGVRSRPVPNVGGKPAARLPGVVTGRRASPASRANNEPVAEPMPDALREPLVAFERHLG